MEEANAEPTTDATPRPNSDPNSSRTAEPGPESTPAAEPPRRRYELDDRGFDEVPEKYRKFYRRWEGAGDSLAPNEALCPVCKVVIRSRRELRVGDRLYCMACMARMVVVEADDGSLEAQVVY